VTDIMNVIVATALSVRRFRFASLGGFAFVCCLTVGHGFAIAKSPPAPGENPKRDVEAIKAARAASGVLRLPKVVSDVEAAHNKRFDGFVRPVLKAAVGARDGEKLRAVKKAADAKRFADAMVFRDTINDPVAAKLAHWMLLRRGHGSVSQYRTFLAENPLWPNRWLLIQQLEEKLLKLDNAKTTLEVFREIEPESEVGQVALAVALAKSGRRGEARKLARKAWLEGKFRSVKKKELAGRLSGFVSAADLKRWAKERPSSADASWPKVRSKAYTAMKGRNFKTAYALVRKPKGLSVNPRKDQAFLSGWLALRYLGNVKAAKKHFKVMYENADGPLSRSKSAYWLGRAYEAAGDTAEAEKYYRDAFARQVDTFHAHLARQKLNQGPLDIKIVPPKVPTADQISRFQGLDAAKAAVIADRAKVGRSISRPFLANLGNRFQSESEVALVAHLARALGDTQQSLRIGKKAIGRGMNLVYYGYPLHGFPEYKPLRKPPEPAFMLSVARQESEFNSQTVSSAGARGILQVMPITARHVCRDYKLKCNIKRLLTDESYNTMISSAYIADRMAEFRGSYVLGLAGYNAGPGRARQWIGQFGDPRDGRIDVVDWIERIPFRETRKYVAKVLSNIQMYRARLGEGKPLRLEQDMQRAKSRRAASKRHAPGSRWLQMSSGQ
jgi:peptidoglycan lytic transglycosylase